MIRYSLFILLFLLAACARDVVLIQETPHPNIYAAGSFYSEAGYTFTIDTAGQYYNLTLFDNVMSQGLNVQDNKSVVIYDGVYSIQYHMSFGGGPTIEYHMSIGVNGLEKEECHGARVIGTGGDVGNMGGTCLLSLEAGDVVTLMVENEDNNQDILIKDVSVNMVLI